MGWNAFAGRHRAGAAVVALAALVIAAGAGLYRWIDAAPPAAVLSQTSDMMEKALDRTIVATTADFQMWNRINIAVQCGTILLGLTATLLTASTTAQNAPRLKVATVSVTALTAALVSVQSTFHLRENIHTDAAAFVRLVALESDYMDKRDHPSEKFDARALRRDTVNRLTRIRAERMLSLANIGSGGPEPAREDPKPDGAQKGD